MRNITAYVVFQFQNNSLYEVSILISNFDDSDYTSEELYQQFYEQFKNLYGEGKEYDTIYYVWETRKSRISLMNYMDVYVNYRDKNVPL